MNRSFSATGIVLKRTNVGEADRIVTVFTREFGKITCVAKGCRKMTSAKLSSMEPASLIKMHLIRTNTLPLLTQAQTLESFTSFESDLTALRKTFEVLEILDSLLSEEDEQANVFDRSVAMLSQIKTTPHHTTMHIRNHLFHILEILGFADRDEIDLTKPVKEFIEDVTQRKLKAYAFLQTT